MVQSDRQLSTRTNCSCSLRYRFNYHCTSDALAIGFLELVCYRAYSYEDRYWDSSFVRNTSQISTCFGGMSSEVLESHLSHLKCLRRHGSHWHLVLHCFCLKSKFRTVSHHADSCEMCPGSWTSLKNAKPSSWREGFYLHLQHCCFLFCFGL